MKRSVALQPLSRDHHQALAVAQRLRRADGESEAAAARDAFLEFWRSHGNEHFREEEELLLPAYAEHGDPGHPLVVRVLVEHVVIRQRARRLAGSAAPAAADLRDLGERLASHVRLEERELFPLIESALPGDALDALARALAADDETP